MHNQKDKANWCEREAAGDSGPLVVKKTLKQSCSFHSNEGMICTSIDLLCASINRSYQFQPDSPGAV